MKRTAFQILKPDFSKKKLKMKQCAAHSGPNGERCTNTFVQNNTLHVVCPSYKCASRWSEDQRLKKVKKDRIARRRDTTKRILELKPLSHHMNLTQKVFNRWIVLRDWNEPCISCGTFTPKTTDYRKGRAWQAGHFKSVGAHPELRFDPGNCSKECLHCNLFDETHLIGYRENLIVRRSLEHVEWLDGPHDPKHYTRDFLAEKRKVLNKASRLMKKEIENEN